MKKLLIIMALVVMSSNLFAEVVQTPDGRIITCTRTSIGTIVCL